MFLIILLAVLFILFSVITIVGLNVIKDIGNYSFAEDDEPMDSIESDF